MKKIFFCLLTALIAATITAGVTLAADKDLSLDGDSLNIRTDISTANNIVVVSGAADAGDRIVIEILPGTDMPRELYGEIPDEEQRTEAGNVIYSAETLIAFADECVTDENGNYSVSAGLEKSGSYTVYAVSSATGERVSAPLYFVTGSDYAAVIDELNTHIFNNDEQGFSEILKDSEKMKKLGFEPGFAGSDSDGAAKQMFNELGGKALVNTEYEKNKAIYEGCALITALNKSTVANVDKYIRGILVGDSDSNRFYGSFVKDEPQQTYMTSKLSGKNIANITQLGRCIRDAVILTVVKYPDGYMNIKALLNTYKDYLKIESLTSETSVYAGLAGKDYTDTKALADEYNRLVKSNVGKKPTGSGNSGSSGGSGGSGISGGAKTAGIPTVPNSGNSRVSMSFDDLDTVTWAYEAISTLADVGIISGKSETKFVPRENISREEFVKLALCVMGEKPKESKGIFSDVSPEKWFAGYVERACELSIVNGVGSGVFGAGESITRQDMAVILYRVMQCKGLKTAGSAVAFADAEDISDYARVAIEAMYAANAVKGDENGYFNPHSFATRAEAAMMVFGVYRIVR